MDKDVERVLDAAQAISDVSVGDVRPSSNTWGTCEVPRILLIELSLAMKAFERSPDPPTKVSYPMDVLLPASRTQALKGLVR